VPDWARSYLKAPAEARQLPAEWVSTPDSVPLASDALAWTKGIARLGVRRDWRNSLQDRYRELVGGDALKIPAALLMMVASAPGELGDFVRKAVLNLPAYREAEGNPGRACLTLT
jgi:hypothetical protein